MSKPRSPFPPPTPAGQSRRAGNVLHDSVRVLMTVPLVLCALVTPMNPPVPKLPTPMRDVDYRVLQLYDADVRKDKKRLAAVLDDIWKLLPEPATFQEQLQKEKMAEHGDPYRAAGRSGLAQSVEVSPLRYGGCTHLPDVARLVPCRDLQQGGRWPEDGRRTHQDVRRGLPGRREATRSLGTRRKSRERGHSTFSLSPQTGLTTPPAGPAVGGRGAGGGT
jgi:hypothetical protein